MQKTKETIIPFYVSDFKKLNKIMNSLYEYEIKRDVPSAREDIVITGRLKLADLVYKLSQRNFL